MTLFFWSFFVHVEKGYKCYGLWRHKNVFYLFEKITFMMVLRTRVWKKNPVKPVLSPNVQISEN